MFKSARLKLTAWYLLIISIISLAFSLTIYSFLAKEINRFSEVQRLRIERKIEKRFPDEVIRRFPAPPPDFSDPDIVKETKARIILALLSVNGVIIVVSGFLSYFLSGKTLEPIKEMMDDQDRFISDASHELRTPLTALKTNIEVALRNKRINLIDAKKTLRENLEDVDDLTNLANTLLELSQVSIKTSNFNYQIVSSKNLVTNAIDTITPQAKSKQIKIIKKVGYTDLFVDTEKISRALSILLDNAIKFSAKNNKVKVYTSKNSKFLTFHVQDFGVGISPKDYQKVFERFFRGDNSRTNSNKQGFGLGLAIAKSIVVEHQGSLTFDSKEGEGSTFHLKLPIASGKIQPKTIS